MDSLEKKSNIAKKKIDTTRLANGQKVGQYIILNEIDRGGMAVVYRAQQLGLDRYVALIYNWCNLNLEFDFHH